MDAEKILNDPSASYWLKDALKSALNRDRDDAANDAEVLARVLADRSGSSWWFPRLPKQT